MIILGALLFAVMLITIGSEEFILRKEENITPEIGKTESPETEAEFSTDTRSNNWFTVTVDSLRDCGRYTSIALDQMGNPHISYQGWTDNDLKYASWNGSVWNREVIDDAGFSSTSLALMPGSDIPHISYYEGGMLRHAFIGGGGQWVKETVEQGNVGEYSSIAIGNDNSIHISYYDAGNTDLKYAVNHSVQWNSERVDGIGTNTGKYTSITLPANNTPHIGQYHHGVQRPKFAARRPVGGWNEDIVDNNNMRGECTSVALMGGSVPHMTYYDAGNGNLMLASSLK